MTLTSSYDPSCCCSAAAAAAAADDAVAVAAPATVDAPGIAMMMAMSLWLFSRYSCATVDRLYHTTIVPASTVGKQSTQVVRPTILYVCTTAERI